MYKGTKVHRYVQTERPEKTSARYGGARPRLTSAHNFPAAGKTKQFLRKFCEY